MRSANGPGAQITAVVVAWPGVEAGPGTRGEFAFRVGGKEIGHLHGDHAAHFGFPKQVWRELRDDGRIEPHPVVPDREGPASHRISDEQDVREVIDLMRLNYDRLTAPREPATETDRGAAA